MTRIICSECGAEIRISGGMGSPDRESIEICAACDAKLKREADRVAATAREAHPAPQTVAQFIRELLPHANAARRAGKCELCNRLRAVSEIERMGIDPRTQRFIRVRLGWCGVC
ncbi:MAG: hypothetical protein ABSE45_14930 [Candidatus Acidiferrales bacterium]